VSGDNVVPFAQPLLTFGGPIDDAAVSLKAYGDDLDPDEITGLLGVAPTYSHRLGDSMRPGSPPFQTGCWTHKVESAGPGDAADQALGCLLDRLPSDPSLWARLVQSYQIRIFFRIGFTGCNKGFGLSAVNLRRIAALGVRVEFDLSAEDKMSPELLTILNGPSGGLDRRPL
jgi:uncharacterized protein DUF4279